MSTNTRTMKATPEQVWEVLADGWLYPLWVVGASRMREVEEAWPEKGSRIHHSVGTWPALIDDHTEVLEVEPGSLLVLKARAWPTGSAKVTVRLAGVGAQTEVTLEEVAFEGPPTLVPQPLLDVPLHWRNTESLERLAYVVERRDKHRGDRGTDRGED